MSRAVDATPARVHSTSARVGRGALIGLVGAVINAMSGMALVVVAARGLGVAGSGVLFTCVALFTVLSNVLKIGADTGLIRFLSRAGAPTSAPARLRLIQLAVRPAVLISLAVASVLALASEVVGRWVLPDTSSQTQVLTMVIIAAGLPLGTATLVLLGAARGLGTVTPFVAIEQIGKPLARVVLVLLVVAVLPTPTWAVLAWSLPLVVGLIAVIRYVERGVHRPAGENAARTNATPAPREFWNFAAARGLASAFEIASVWIAVVLLSAMATSSDAGVFTAASRFVALGGTVMLAVRLAVAPELSRLLSTGRVPAAERLHQLCTTWIVATSWPIFLFGAVFAPTVLSIFGADFRSGASAIAVLAAANLVNLAVGNAQTVLLMVGKSSYNMINTGLALAVQLGLDIALIPHHGVLGAAIGVGAGTVVDNVLSAYQVRRYVGMRSTSVPYALVAGLSVLFFLVLAFGGRVLLGTGVVAFVVTGVLCSGAYVAALAVLRTQLGLTRFRALLTARGGRRAATA